MDKNTIYLGQPIFTQVLSLIDDSLISKACKLHKSDKYSKSLSFKSHLVTMLYTVFAKCTSLREVQTGLELCNGKLNHLNLTKVPPRSTLSDGNKNRSSKVFETLYLSLFEKYKHIISDSRLAASLASKLYILDSSTISLFKAILKPAGRKRDDGKSKGGIKVHTLLKADSNMPCFIKFTASSMHDQQFYECIKELPNHSIITFDKAYINYEQFDKFQDRGITYVVPQKVNAQYKSIKELALIEGEDTTLKDELIEISYEVEIDTIKAQKHLQLRRVAYYSEKHNDTFIYWTNNLELKASEVIAIYQNRWQIEKFFKKLKQNFPLQYFLGDNTNAIEIQIWCALIGLVLLQVIFAEQKTTIAFSILASIVAIHLMNYTSLTSIINKYKEKRVRKAKEKPPNKTEKNTTPPHFQTKFNF
jgi:transposase